MNKVRFGSLPMKCWAMLLGLLVVTAAYTTLTEAPTIMAAVTTRELPVYNVDTQDKVLAISFDAAWGSANTKEFWIYWMSMISRPIFFWWASGRKNIRSWLRSWSHGGMKWATTPRPIRTCRSYPLHRFARSCGVAATWSSPSRESRRRCSDRLTVNTTMTS